MGYEEGGRLAEQIRRRPYSVVLFDEIEKAHPDIFNLLLQILEDGHLTDSQGRRVDFRNTVIILTSNLGSTPGEESRTVGFGSVDVPPADTREEKALRAAFRPEFLNRIDETIMFTPLNEKEIEEIVKLQAANIAKLMEENGVELQVSDNAIKFISKAGFDPEFGARPIKRAMQRYLLNDLSKQLLAGTVDKSKPIKVDSDGNMLLFSNN